MRYKNANSRLPNLMFVQAGPNLSRCLLAVSIPRVSEQRLLRRSHKGKCDAS